MARKRKNTAPAGGEPVAAAGETAEVLRPVPAAKKKPITYSEELGDTIAALLAQGMTLNAICQGPVMPTQTAVRMWALDSNHPFAIKYTRAREIGYQKMADDLMDIADEGSGDAQRDRLRVDTRKWILSKALPKIYGDKVAVTDADGGALQVRFVR